ncbi:SACE_7040 family transcriptional regulator [Microbacterium ulmi]|uniref:TetR/AcrR family transcriptional regulator n=1 Tax=Microbacterium ulmi TaxID=179095 RepID=A0A7Y2M0L6_9MICO|nr:TetR/AcrR family transcriptional regulator [Microbacterium ulmi]NII70869.1 AcrR family transcriptional regulator [Microbacterium ulmi]NNH02883.1 TetR/AcrR family transcriptional regulator [Microbacterium ulmi]
MTSGVTERTRAKADRHSALLREAARLFAERGFSGVSLEELGAAVGVSGPAVYRHFANKQALLGEILVGVSERLLAGGRDVVSQDAASLQTLQGLVRFHVDFALADADVIRVQDRDLASLGERDRHDVRRLQREYSELWVAALSRLHPGRADSDLRVRASACFGLINSTPHSVRGLRGAPDDDAVRGILESMALAALTA